LLTISSSSGCQTFPVLPSPYLQDQSKGSSKSTQPKTVETGQRCGRMLTIFGGFRYAKSSFSCTRLVMEQVGGEAGVYAQRKKGYACTPAHVGLPLQFHVPTHPANHISFNSTSWSLYKAAWRLSPTIEKSHYNRGLRAFYYGPLIAC
jgi:hypothetical protein